MLYCIYSVHAKLVAANYRQQTLELTFPSTISAPEGKLDGRSDCLAIEKHEQWVRQESPQVTMERNWQDRPHEERLTETEHLPYV
jgi:hypothetical protein